jgi:hypothetical protein
MQCPARSLRPVESSCVEARLLGVWGSRLLRLACWAKENPRMSELTCWTRRSAPSLGGSSRLKGEPV